MESEGSLPSQDPTTGPYPELDHSSSYPISLKFISILYPHLCLCLTSVTFYDKILYKMCLLNNETVHAPLDFDHICGHMYAFQITPLHATCHTCLIPDFISFGLCKTVSLK
jgi:hypothetical protein